MSSCHGSLHVENAFELIQLAVTAGKFLASCTFPLSADVQLPPAFSALRVYALAGRKLWYALLVLSLSLVPFVTNLVRKSSMVSAVRTQSST